MGISLSKKICETWRLFILIRIKLYISLLAFASAKLAILGGLQESSSAALY